MLWTQQIWSSAAQSIKTCLLRQVVSALREYYFRVYFFFRHIPVQKTDLAWAAFLPVYMMADTLRHEMSHALAAWVSGSRVLAINVFPGNQLGYFSYGYTILDERATAVVYAAPYICDLVLFSMVFTLLRFQRLKARWVYINLVMLGILSPIYNSVSGFVNSFMITNDVGRLTILFPRSSVLLTFAVGILYYLFLTRGLYRLWIFHAWAVPPFWHAWAEGKRACRHQRLVWKN